MSLLRINLFGPLQIFTGEQCCEIRLSRTVQALFACLLLERNRVFPREALAEMLWNEGSDQHTRHNLNTTLWRLRSALEKDAPGGKYLVSTHLGEVGINPHSRYWLDVAEFEAQARVTLSQPAAGLSPFQAGQMEDALQLYRGDLMEGFYQNWAINERERMRLVYLGCLSHLLNYYRSRHEYTRCLEYGQRILAIDPLREEIHCEMIRAYLAMGRRSEAIGQFETCRALLKAELGIEPYPETLGLYRQILEPPVVRPDESSPFTSLAEAQSELLRARQVLETARSQMEDGLRLLEKLNRYFETGPQ